MFTIFTYFYFQVSSCALFQHLPFACCLSGVHAPVDAAISSSSPGLALACWLPLPAAIYFQSLPVVLLAGWVTSDTRQPVVVWGGGGASNSNHSPVCMARGVSWNTQKKPNLGWGVKTVRGSCGQSGMTKRTF